MRSLILIGGGEHARVVIEAIRAQNTFAIIGFVDPLPCEETVARTGVRRLGDEQNLNSIVGEAWAVLAFGTVHHHERRMQAVERLTPLVRGWATIVHPYSYVSPSAMVAPGTVISSGAVVQVGSQIGIHVVVNSGAIVEHDVIMGDFSQVAPGGVIGGGARVGEGAYVGLGARVRDHVHIGTGAVVGMGAVVVKDVADGMIVTGVPAQ